MNWNIIKAIVVLALVSFLFGFAEQRNERREISGVSVDFEEGENLYVTADIVNKLLIQSNPKVTNTTKETIALKELEKRLDDHEMISDSDVYITVDGKLGASVKQRKPIARVYGSEPFYIDAESKLMPMSKNYSARVPLVFNCSKNDVEVVFPLLDYATKDDFLKKHLTEIYKQPNGTFTLALRDVNFEVDFGNIDDVNRKVSNLKAFYKKALKDKKLDLYSKVNLQFGSQVICTKKEVI